MEDAKVEEKVDTVVATFGDQKLTNGELQAYYWMSVYDFLNQYGKTYKYALVPLLTQEQSGVEVEEFCPVYNASKHGSYAYRKAIQRDLAKHNIKITDICNLNFAFFKNF